jgi:hypothetical protein
MNFLIIKKNKKKVNKQLTISYYCIISVIQ